MKKNLKVFCASLLLGCLMAFPAQAVETKAEYQEAITPIRSEIEEINHDLKTLREDNKTSPLTKQTGKKPKNFAIKLQAYVKIWKNLQSRNFTKTHILL